MARVQNGTCWERFGVARAPTIVLVHGLGLNRHVWQWMIPTLERDYDVISYDLLGHGDSRPALDTPSLSLFGEQLASVLDAAGVARAALIGFSLGGMIIRRFAQDYPDRTAALVILNSAHRRTAQAQTAIEKRVDQAASEGPSATVDAALERWFTDAFRAAHPDMMSLVGNWVLANNPDVYHKNYHVLAHGIDEIVAPSPRLCLPSLVITGDEDVGNGPEMAKAIAYEIDGAEVKILRGLRHMALAEDPTAVNAPVNAFLASVMT
ncbi:MAG: alpha/beta hydrolase [Pseudomonadota bacterium]